MGDASDLLPAELRARLPALYATEKQPDPIVRAKFFTPWAGWTWLVTEFDGDDRFFGLVSGHEVELGYFSLSELQALRGPGGLTIERDLHFSPRPLSIARAELSGPADSTKEARPDYSGSSLAQAFVGAASPLDHPGIQLVETRLAPGGAQPRSDTIATPQQAAAVLRALIGEADREHFVALYLNARHRITHAHMVSRGNAHQAVVHPREVFKAAILANATSVIVGHNHPSGTVEPSAEDRAISARLKQAAAILGIDYLDALIVGPTRQFHAESIPGISWLSGERPEPAAPVSETLERVCLGLLQDAREVLERQGRQWWDATVTAGSEHQTQAKKALGLTPYGLEDVEPGPP